MTTPTVTETAVALEPVTRDDFADSELADTLARVRQPAPPTQRERVLGSLLRCPTLAAERRRS